MSFSALISKIDRKGLFSFAAVTYKTPLKKSRIDKKPTPARFLTVTKYTACTVSLGSDYENAVNNRLAKEGKESSFESQGTYCLPVGDSGMIFEHKTSGQEYLRVYLGLAASFQSVALYFDSEGVEITAEWDEIEAEFFAQRSDNSSQGLDNPVIPLNYKVEGVVYLKQGDFVYNEIPLTIRDLIKKAA